MNEREIASWQARTTESEKLALELSMCMQAVETTKRLWEIGDDEDKQGMARHLFDYIIFDLDRQFIVDFRLKAWADQFVISRVALHLEENDELSNDENGMTPTSVRTVHLPSLNSIIARLLEHLYLGTPVPQQPITEKHISKDERNQQICLRFAAGDHLEEIADEFDISVQRVAQLIHRWC